MRIGSNYGYGFDPYHDYTEVLKKTTYMPEGLSYKEPTAYKTSEDKPVQNKTDSDDDSNLSYAVAAMDNIKALDIEDIIGDEGLKSGQSKESVQSIADTLKGIQDFDLIGRDSSIASLDTSKAVSNMKKDSVLQQYQYFVDSPDSLGTMEDGLFFRKNGLY